MDKLSKDVRVRLENAFGNDTKSAKALADTVDNIVELASQYQLDEKFSDVGFMNATTPTNADAVTMGLRVGDLVAIVNTTGQAIQEIVTDDEFAVAPAVGDLLIAKRPRVVSL